MSGGTTEYVMGVKYDFNGMPWSGLNMDFNSGFTGYVNAEGIIYTGSIFPESEYYNLYTGSSYTGHALIETMGWYGDSYTYVDDEYSWYARGGDYINRNGEVGIFSSLAYSGYSVSGISSRPVISNE